MQIEKIKKIATYVGFALKSNHIVIGADDLSKVNKKLYLIIKDESAGNNLNKIVNRISEKTKSNVISMTTEEMFLISNKKNVKVIGLKNKNLSEVIEKIIKE